MPEGLKFTNFSEELFQIIGIPCLVSQKSVYNIGHDLALVAVPIGSTQDSVISQRMTEKTLQVALIPID
jgi:hypothetical protein